MDRFAHNMLDWNGYRHQVGAGVSALAKLTPEALSGSTRSNGHPAALAGNFPDTMVPVIRKAPDSERELTLMRWGFPPPPNLAKVPVTNVRDTASPYWRGRLDSSYLQSLGQTIALRGPRDPRAEHSSLRSFDDWPGGENDMPDSVYKVIELVGTSSKSWEDAAATAVERASQTLRDLRVAVVTEQDVQIKDGKIEFYRTKLKLSFKFEGSI